MTAPIRDPLRAAVAAAQIDHNGGPLLEDVNARKVLSILDPKIEEPLQPFECGAPWTGWADDADLIAAAKIERRIALRNREIKQLRKTRQKIMMKSIRRMRRAKGLT
ncbi:MAG: hypothetical protein ACRBB0_15305 [Pelagimonas sp.]|uniref:hypothetical protein n=1 Tax=Pelagimonas sp. TaxID=2073170 RepID=UPI003D6C32DB